jgi:hypothetical protein
MRLSVASRFASPETSNEKFIRMRNAGGLRFPGQGVTQPLRLANDLAMSAAEQSRTLLCYFKKWRQPEVRFLR